MPDEFEVPSASWPTWCYDKTQVEAFAAQVARYASDLFAPTLIGTGAVTYTKQLGAFTRVGESCIFSLALGWSATDVQGKLRIGGLPFTCADISGHCPALTIRASGIKFAGIPQAVVIAGSNYASIRQLLKNGKEVAVGIPLSGEISLSGLFPITTEDPLAIARRMG